MKELVEYIAKALVDFPEQVDVKQVEERSIILELRSPRKIWARLSASRDVLPKPSGQWLMRRR